MELIMEFLKNIWNFFKFIVLVLWELLMFIAFIVAPESRIFAVVLGVFPLVMYCRGSRGAVRVIAKSIKRRKEKKRISMIPYTAFYQKLNTNEYALFIKDTLKANDLYQGIIITSKAIYIGDLLMRNKGLLYAEYGLRDLTDDEEEIFAYWILNNCVKDIITGAYQWRIRPYYKLIGGTVPSSSPPIYRQSLTGDYIPISTDNGPDEVFCGYEIKIKSNVPLPSQKEW